MDPKAPNVHGEPAPMGQPARPRNTALFIDLENLFGGPGKGLEEQLESLSISDVMAAITREGRAAGVVDQYAVKCAYADWSDRRLRVLRNEMVEQGIEPRQVFAFGQNKRRNAADVELVIDVLDLAYTRPSVTTMVIVSGDGGFGTLVRRLHESGHTVIVCSFERHTSPALKAVADLYLELGGLLAPAIAESAPTAEALQVALAVPPAIEAADRGRGRAAWIMEVLGGAEPLTRPSREEAADYLREAVGRLAGDRGCADWIAESGIPLTELVKALRSRIEGFDDAILGFRSPAYFLRYALRDTPWAIASDASTGQRLALVRRDAPPTGYDVFDDLGEPDPEQVYRMVLQQERLRLPSDTSALPRVLAHLCAKPPQAEVMQELIERLSDAVSDAPTETVKFSALLLRNAGLLERDDGDDIAALECRHTLPVERADVDLLLARLADQVRAALQARLGHVEESVLALLLPPAEPPLRGAVDAL